ncbi:MAG: DUF3822 family protein [Saprospiraceae bacterium]
MSAEILAQENIRNQDQKMLSVTLMSDSIFCCAMSRINGQFFIDEFKEYIGIKHSDFEHISERIQSDFDLSDIEIRFQIMQGPAIIAEVGDNKPKNFPSLDHKIIYSQPLYSVDNPLFFAITRHQQAFTSLLNPVHTSLKHFCHVLDWWYVGRNSSVIHVHFDRKHLFIYGKQQNQVFYNDFQVDGNEDILYFIMSAYKALNLSPKLIPLHISGWLESNSPLFTLLHGYFVVIHFVDLQNFDVKQGDSVKTHFYFDHYLNVTCGS